MNRQGKLRKASGAKAPSFVALDGTAEAVPSPNR